MEPLALAAIVGLVFAGQRLSDKPVTTVPIMNVPPHQLTRLDTDLAADAPGRRADAAGRAPRAARGGPRLAALHALDIRLPAYE